MTRASAPPLVIIVDRREQAPLYGLPLDKANEERVDVAPGVMARWGTLSEGDYAAEGFEHVARVERKSGADALNTITWDHRRFSAERVRLLRYRRAVLVIDDCHDYRDLCTVFRASVASMRKARAIMRSIERASRLPIAFCGTPAKAATYVEHFLREVVEDYAPAKLERAAALMTENARARIAADLPPFASVDALIDAALAASEGYCPHCMRRLGVRPKAAGPNVCACGRLKAKSKRGRAQDVEADEHRAGAA